MKFKRVWHQHGSALEETAIDPRLGSLTTAASQSVPLSISPADGPDAAEQQKPAATCADCAWGPPLAEQGPCGNTTGVWGVVGCRTPCTGSSIECIKAA